MANRVRWTSRVAFPPPPPPLVVGERPIDHPIPSHPSEAGCVNLQIVTSLEIATSC